MSTTPVMARSPPIFLDTNNATRQNQPRGYQHPAGVCAPKLVVGRVSTQRSGPPVPLVSTALASNLGWVAAHRRSGLLQSAHSIHSKARKSAELDQAQPREAEMGQVGAIANCAACSSERRSYGDEFVGLAGGVVLFGSRPTIVDVNSHRFNLMMSRGFNGQ